jgi:hypothetical protein
MFFTGSVNARSMAQPLRSRLRKQLALIPNLEAQSFMHIVSP